MRTKSEKGQAMVEFALVLPIFLLLLCGIVDFGWIFGNQLLANNACREATRYTAIHYNDSSTDDDRDIAEAIIKNAAPLLKDPTVSLSKDDSNESITVSMSCSVSVLTPFLSSILGQDYEIGTNCVMRLE